FSEWRGGVHVDVDDVNGHAPSLPGLHRLQAVAGIPEPAIELGDDDRIAPLQGLIQQATFRPLADVRTAGGRRVPKYFPEGKPLGLEAVFEVTRDLLGLDLQSIHLALGAGSAVGVGGWHGFLRRCRFHHSISTFTPKGGFTSPAPTVAQRTG